MSSKFKKPMPPSAQLASPFVSKRIPVRPTSKSRPSDRTLSKVSVQSPSLTGMMKDMATLPNESPRTAARPNVRRSSSPPFTWACSPSEAPAPDICCVPESQPPQHNEAIVKSSVAEVGLLKSLEEYGDAIFACWDQSLSPTEGSPARSATKPDPGSQIVDAKKRILELFRNHQSANAKEVKDLTSQVNEANASARQKGTEVEQLARENKDLKKKLGDAQSQVVRYRRQRDDAVKGEREMKEQYGKLSGKHARSRTRAKEVWEASKKAKLE